MNKSRLSYGLLVTLAAAALMVGCGDSTPPVENPPQPTAAPADTGAPAPTQTAAVEAPAPTQAPAEPPPPPPKPAKEKFAGKYTQDFAGDVATAAQAAADKAGGAKKDQKKIDASLEKAKKAFGDAAISLDNSDKVITWTVKGKARELTYEVTSKADDANALTLKVIKDGKKDISKKPIEITISFTGDNTFEMVDPFAKKDPKKLVFKK